MTFRPEDVLTMLGESSVRAALIVGAVAALLAVLRVKSGTARHAAWTAVLVAMLAMPVLPRWVPAIDVPLFPVAARSARVETSPAPSLTVTQPGPAVNVPATIPAAPTVAAPATAAPAASARAPVVDWPLVILLVWVLGAALFLARLVAGWIGARRLASGSAATGLHSRIFESPLVSTPVTVGVVSPRTVLPTSWRAWPAETRTAVLVHELAHIRRRDGAVSLLARANRAIFWFHPLAWWLERQLAFSAEQACDDEVMRRAVEPARYAALLVGMAATVRAEGGRVAWQAVGMAGGGRLGSRIDRVLTGEAGTRLSVLKKVAVALTCALAIVLGVACQRSVAPLRPDPALAAQLERQRQSGAEYEAAKSMTLDQVAALEATAAASPDDLDATRKLLIFYRNSGQKVMGWNEMVAARRPHLLRMIERHPDSELAAWPFKRSLDPEGYDMARALWMSHIEKPDATAPILVAAAERFFRIAEKPFAEQLLLRAQALDPTTSQSANLGVLYAQAMVGSDDETLGNVVRSVSLEVAKGPFATAAKQKLAESRDAVLLRQAGIYLIYNAGSGEASTVGDQQLSLAFDPKALGNSYLDRAAKLDPDSETTKIFEYSRRRGALDEEQSQRRRAILGAPRDQIDDARLAQLSASDRFEVLPDLATFAYFTGENTEWAKQDRSVYEAAFNRAKDYAERTLTVAEDFRGDPRYGPYAFSAHVTLGLVALRNGNRELAVTHMREATGVLKPDDVLTSWDAILYARLGRYLVSVGERESVARFLEAVSKFQGPMGRAQAEAAAAIREGRMPSGYQRAMTPR